MSRTDDRYSLDAFRRCKVHYLKESLLRGRAVVICGAGPVGKEFARELRAQGVEVRLPSNPVAGAPRELITYANHMVLRAWDALK